jgi:choline dehydrogenase-like flavoprotein
VILVEEGLFFGREDFSGGALAMQKLLYRDLGLSASIGNVPIMLPTGRCVGGTTTVNSGTCYRAKDRVLQGWQEQLGLTAHGPEQLAPFYERVEAVLGVEVAATKYLGHAAEAIARGATRLGYTHQPLRRNAPDCDGQGLCCFGCPTDAKRSTNVSYVPMALRAGAELIVNARVQRLLIEDGAATGVEVVAGSAPSGHVSSLSRFRVRARAVVLACGTFGTATLLQSDPVAQRMLSRSGALGQNLTIHPTSGVFAEFDTPMQMGRFIPQSYAIEEFHDQGLLMEGVSTPLDLTALNSPLVGRVYSEVMEAYPRTAGFGFLLEDSTTGSVQPGPAGRPLIRYNLTGRDIKRIQHGLRLLCDLFFAAGSYRVQLPVRGFDLIRSDEKSRLDALQHAAIPASDFFLTAYHPLGTARMSSSPTSGIVSEDLAAHDLPGLYIMDGSVVPSSPAVNPQLTIMALASRAAQRLAERLNQPAS